jgi:hypothetical protein
MNDAMRERPRTEMGDALPPGCTVIEVHVAELRQLFDAIDPSPFREKDLNPNAAEFIIGWANDTPRDAPLALLVHVDRPSGTPDEAGVVGDAIHRFFSLCAQRSRRRLRQLFHRGRLSLVIGLAFLAVLIGLGDLAVRSLPGSHLAEVLREGLLIGGWVAMWRPLEVFLYDWWPIRAEARVFDRLAAMPVRIQYDALRPSDAWRRDRRAVAAAADTRTSTSAAPTPQGMPVTGSERGTFDTRAAREAALDRALEETFPASDPISSQVPSTVVR